MTEGAQVRRKGMRVTGGRGGGVTGRWRRKTTRGRAGLRAELGEIPAASAGMTDPLRGSGYDGPAQR